MLASVEVLRIVAVSVSGYLAGSVPFASFYASRRGVDLRAVGDRNPGYWNARAALGGRRALPVLGVDAAKGAGAAALGMALGPWWLGYVGAGAAMVGHAWPLFARFRGGRCVATFIGAAIVLSPLSAAGSLLIGLGVWGASRRFEFGVRAAVLGFPLVQLLADGPHPTAASGALMSLIGLRFAMAAGAARGAGGVEPDGPSSSRDG
jgi:glycerol-3-phosphate acyltransferase PlsY